MKKIKILLIALLLILGGAIFSDVQAEEIEKVKAQEARPFTPATYTYKAGLNDNHLDYTLVKIFYETDTTFSRPIYCLRGNVGFGGTDVNYTNAVRYKLIGEMHNNASTVLSNYGFSTLNRTETINEKSVNLYNAILWILDESYLPISKENYNEEEYKTELLNKAGIPESEHSKITKDDIEAIQQLAIWFFTNFDEQGQNATSVSQPYNIYRSQYLAINGNNDALRDRAEYLDKVYYYFVDGAIENNGRYGTNHTYTPKSYEFGKVMSSGSEEEKLTIKQQFIPIGSGNPQLGMRTYSYVGPFTVNLKEEDGINSRGTNETIDASKILLYLQDSSNEEKWDIISKYKILKDVDNVITISLQRSYGFVEADNITDISELNSASYVNQLKIGSKYYIKVDGLVENRINTNSKIKLEITSTYNLATANYLVAETDSNNQQPLVEINKEKKSESDIITNVPKKEFDLSLRKFITSINHRGQVTNITNRAPQVNVDTLINGIENRSGEIEYTATYTHTKEAITVETGDIVTYTIRVYNEGEADGTATQVTDYLPEGLELVPVSESTINTQYGWQNPSGDKKTIVTNYLANKTIDAFDKTAGVNGLKYEDIQVECKVVAAVTENEQQFRNIAAITEDNDEDRDSEPGDPGRTDYNPPTDNSTYKQDDDDYEDLKMEGKRIDLSLRKFISKVQRPHSETGVLETVTIDSREPQVEIKTLKAGTSQTARYSHTKDILTLKRGDIITYTIRVYNEGNVDAYATQIKDYLPEELELVEGQNDIWTIDGNTLTTDALKDKLIPAYDKTKTDSTIPSGMDGLKWKKAKDDTTGLYYYDLNVVCKIKGNIDDGQVIKNIAEIAADKSNPEGLSDRDSQVNNVLADGRHDEKTEQNGYVPGEQDDDDFEKVTVDSGFDLSLRKYITAINGNDLTGNNSRVPVIDVNPLKQLETTADYNHRKNAVIVETGDVVTYTIRVYNEGEMNGSVTEIKDILPEGMEFDSTGLTSVQSPNENIKIWQKLETGVNCKYTYKYTFNETTRELTITSSEVNTNTDITSTDNIFNLKASNFEHQDEQTTLKTNVGNTGWTRGLNYGEIKINCKVIARVTNSDQVLTNVATMTYKAENADTVVDRDSNKTGIEFTEPTAEELVSETEKPYKGNSANKDELNDSNYHYAGQQDDDDFEKIVIKGKSFDLSLRKYITAVNGTNLTRTDSRIPTINVTPLEQSETTADYKHKKYPVEVKNGDIVTYRFSVYNEGEITGEVYSIIDYLPEGLEFDVQSNPNFIEYKDNYTSEELTGKEYAYKIEGNKITITPLNKTVLFELAPFNGISLENVNNIDVKFKVNVIETDKNQVLTNVATMTYGAKGTNLKDRDSNKTGIEFREPTAEELVSETEKPYKGNSANKDELNDSNYYYAGQQDDDDFEKIVIKGKSFDLSLRKYILSVNGNNLTGEKTRVPNIDVTPLKQLETTADYKHKKDPVEVQIGDIVTYRFSVYNEGEIAGEVYSIVDYLPQGLEFDTKSNEKFIAYKETYTQKELIGKEYEYKIEGNKITIKPINKTVLFELAPFNGTSLENANNIDVKFKVTAVESSKDQVLTNVATMTYGAKGTDLTDRDSNKTGIEFREPTAEELISETEKPYKGNSANKDQLNDSNYHYAGQQDDDDFEKIVIKGKKFDLSLRKFITAVKRNGQNIELEDRSPIIDTTTLINGTFDRNGQTENTATYEHSKEPVVVKKGDIVTYTIRVYNEGQRDGYAEQITENIPEGLALILGYQENVWWEGIDNNVETISLIGENGIYKTEEEATNFSLEDFTGVNSLEEVQLIPGKVSFVNSKLSSRDEDNLIKAFDSSLTAQTAGTGWQPANKGQGGLYYKDIQISCLVIADNTSKDTITNVAEISIDKDKNKQDVEDEDSTPNNVGNRNEDDNDFEPVVLKYFDLALRKFITGIETNGTMKEITSRIPVPTIGEDGNIVYEHTKEPLHVANNDIVTYTIRVYNEGTVSGYAEEITDDIPNGLEFLPEHDTNKQYEWVMIDKDGNETDDVEEAVKITTKYLSQEKEEKNNMVIADGTTGEIIDEPTEIIDNKIDPLDISKEPLIIDYKDVKVAFRVVEPKLTDEAGRIIVNSAQISEDSDDDEDSKPGKWNEGEDDQDREKIYVDKFDLSLLKWVTETIVTVDGKTTTTATGFEPNTGKTETTDIRDNETPEPVAKVEIDKKKINKTQVKFVYKIRVTNEGQIAGYASEVTDYIPEGLEFIAEDNQAFGWVKDGDNKVVTRALETVLLQPGETAELSIVFTWKNDANNLGVKTNIAEISEDDNAHDAKDIDSTPDNKVKPYESEQEDDDDYALVLLSIKTGKQTSYTLFIIAMLALLAGGMYLIKKYVLEA